MRTVFDACRSIKRASGRGLGPGNGEFLGPVKWPRADRRVHLVLSAEYGLAVWMHWRCIDEIILGFKSGRLYPSPPLGVDSADNSHLPAPLRGICMDNSNYLILPQLNNPARCSSIVTPLYHYTRAASVPLEAAYE